MNNDTYDTEQESLPIMQRFRNSIFPIKQTDTMPVRLLKNSGFTMFAVMVALVTLLLGGAIMFVL